MKKILLFCSAFLLSFSLFAQVRYLSRVEFANEKRKVDNYSVINLKEQGVLTLFETPLLLREGKREIIFTLNDTALVKKWVRSLAVEAEEEILLHKISKNRLFLLLGKPISEHRLIVFDLPDGHFSFIEMKKVMELEVSHFEVIDDLIFLGGSTKNSPVVLSYEADGRAHKPTVLPGINHLRAVLSDLQTDSEGKNLCVTLKNKNLATPMLYFNMYSKDGKPIGNWMQGPEDEFFILTSRAYVPETGRQLLFGTYATKNRGKAQGIFAAVYENNEQSVIRKYDFAYLKNFFNYLSDKKRERLFKKIESKRAMKKTHRQGFNLFVGEPEFGRDRIFLTVESYFPMFQERENVSGNFGRLNNRRGTFGTASNGSLNNFSRRNGREPYGYRYKHAGIFCFDKTGLLKWDNSFIYTDLESRTAERFLAVRPDSESAEMLHLQDDKFFFKRSSGSEKTEEQEVSLALPGELPGEGGKISNREGETLSGWYGDKFLMYGVQHIKRKKSGKNRFVFYLAKLDLNGVLIKEKESENSKPD